MRLRLLSKFLTIQVIFSLFFFCGNSVFAEGEGLTLSITPPLFKVGMSPGETWASAVKIINNNSYPLTIYAQVVDFKSGEAGGVEFITSEDQSDIALMSQWIDIDTEPVSLEAFSSKEIPFFVKAPADASPGGHYAAILTGTTPPEGQPPGSSIKVSSKLASLILARVAGEINEDGEITEFSTSRYFNKNTAAEFTIRFSNTGNVHIHPEGGIKIYNIFGQERGSIDVNKKASFGNVLPDSEKKWNFGWQGKSAIYDAGLMKAELLMNYGEEAKHSATRTIYFLSVDLKPTLAVLGSILFIIFLIVLLIRRYIRKSVNRIRDLAGLAETNFARPALKMPAVKERPGPAVARNAAPKSKVIDMRAKK